ncbi:hydroxymethylglutaryl-CoA synthase [Enterococcus haemoperoxidus ATCC BAA-382]|uniref:Hydroxymethylglutaryl-CoA synthase n=1 Tax=Enterococcus haemoperoxidus ATCC BAA-382 TaxID=1158608 RepID=R2TF07_9ENTE|nr:hydroxymethylglutaryl-CoA synthase [Enterococcus haemoperoxidus]EOH98734.1 hydroxymethylglutaryl-CoA synthase [Enterococcus haemoperoxidus ATCC BAA-382]EOT62083.1 hydroxymethylglutaryl-CoA synthase [Enterococcus haemoperoxidus ATCC BAA-382]OJG55837.1 hydroxymethylglutaryl-CoA synthase [Enterococcus haemoperoxidus]
MNVGIDKISFFVPPYYVDMTDLALAREVDPNKFHIGIGQDKMAVNKKTQDIVTFAANAAKNILTDEDKKQIDMVIVGTESGIDESKASAVVLHRLLGIQPFARAFEIKEACYAGTAALQYAVAHIQSHPESRVLVIASDIAKYGLASGGEPTQGAGAVAMLVSAAPRILQLNDDSVALTQDIYDFWRPVGHDYPMVDGQLSNETYIQAFQKVWEEYQRRHNKSIADFHALAFHIPYTKMGKKALLAALEDESSDEQERILNKYESSILYSRQVGNLYTGSLYLGLISLLENGGLDAGEQVGLFSYGSGTVAEFFSGTLVEGYQTQLLTDLHQKQLAERKVLSIAEYEEIFNDVLNTDVDSEYEDSLLFSITATSNTVRAYKEK